MPEENTESILWKRLKNGDREAFEIIYRNYIQELINYGKRFTNELDLIEDAVHDLFLYIWKKRERLSETDSIKAYLLFSLRNTLLRNLKKRHRVVSQEDHIDLATEENTKEQKIIDIERNAEIGFRLDRSFENLSNREKEALFLKYYNGMDYENICRIMDINYQSVRNLISRALKKIQNNLNLKEKK